MADEAAVVTAPEPVAPVEVVPDADPTSDTIQIEIDPVDASLEQPVETPTETVETPTEEAPVETPAEVKPTEPTAAEKRVAALEEELTKAKNALAYGDGFLSADEEARVRWIKYRKSRGETLTPELEALIAPKVVAPTEDAIWARIDELTLAGDTKGARAVEMKYIIEPRIKEELRAENETRRKSEAEAAAIRQGEQTARDEMASLAKSYPTLVSADTANPTGFGFKDKEILGKIQEIKKRNHFITLPDAMKLALVELNRWGGADVKKATPKAQIVAKPNAPKILSRSTPAPAKRPVLEKYEDLIEIEVN